MNQLYKNVLLWSVILVMFVAFYTFFNSPRSSATSNSEIPYSEWVAHARAGEITTVEFDGQRYLGRGADGKGFEATGPASPSADLLRELDAHKVSYRFLPWPPPMDVAGAVFLVALLIVLNAMILVELRRSPRT